MVKPNLCKCGHKEDKIYCTVLKRVCPIAKDLVKSAREETINKVRDWFVKTYLGCEDALVVKMFDNKFLKQQTDKKGG